MAFLDRSTKIFRLTADQNSRLERAAKIRGQTQQGFFLTALLRAIEETEAEAELAKEKTQRRRESSTWRGNAPTGLGFAARRPAAAPPAAAAPAPAPVVVNLGHGAGSAGELVQELAAYVATGPLFSRQTRLRAAMEILETTAKTEDDRRERVRQFEEAVSGRIKERPNALRQVSDAVSRFKEFVK